MPTIELRPGLDMAYEDHWFGAPWTTPETDRDDPRQLRILARVDPVGAASGG